MHIAVLIASRGRPEMLKTVVTALDYLKSDTNHITYAIYHDDGDVATAVAVNDLKKRHNVHGYLGQRPNSLGTPMNLLAAELPDADAFCVFADDILPLSPKWDMVIHYLMMDYPVIAWRESNDPRIPTYPVISRRWYDAAGQIYPEAFPYWFNDSWLAQVYVMATQSNVLIPGDLQVGGRRGKTMGMRDLPIWIDFFRITRQYRIAQAKAVAKKLGTPFAVTDQMLDGFDKYDKFLKEKARFLEPLLADTTEPPSPGYQRLLDAALAEIAACTEATATAQA